jgi:hypothetical protein
MHDPVELELWHHLDPPDPSASTTSQPMPNGHQPGTHQAAGEALRDEGARQAIDAADTRGRLAGEQAIHDLAATGRPFTAEDVRDLIGAPLGCRPNVLGGLFLRAAKAGVIEAVGYQPARRAEARSRPLRVWRGRRGVRR